MFVKGKGLWGHLDGSIQRPQDDIDRVKVAQWDSNDAKMISSNMSSIDAFIILNFLSFHYSKDMWDYLNKTLSPRKLY